MQEEKSKVQIAFEIYERVFVDLKNSKMKQSNKHHVNHPDRVEYDLKEVEKEHLNLLKTKLELEIANEAKLSNEKLQSKVWWLNAALVLLSFVIAMAAVFELFQ